jgi:thiol-disulfide isomerase/thioredoxin
MTLFERVHLPSFAGATEWLNSEPLGPAELDGQLVLVNFWTLTCINWLRQEPYVRAWSQAYRDDGLIVIGVHTPEFSFEHVELAIVEYLGWFNDARLHESLCDLTPAEFEALHAARFEASTHTITI